jgi:hypothetical protein
MELSHYWEANSYSAAQDILFSAFYGTQRFITVFTRAHHWALSYFLKVHLNIIQLHYGPGVDSASNVNEYQESFWG